MKVGDRIEVIDFVDQKFVGITGTIIWMDEENDMYEAALSVCPDYQRPWQNAFIFYGGEIKVIDDA